MLKAYQGDKCGLGKLDSAFNMQERKFMPIAPRDLKICI
jgi:hypothetical protein